MGVVVVDPQSERAVARKEGGYSGRKRDTNSPNSRALFNHELMEVVGIIMCDRFRDLLREGGGGEEDTTSGWMSGLSQSRERRDGATFISNLISPRSLLNGLMTLAVHKSLCHIWFCNVPILHKELLLMMILGGGNGRDREKIRIVLCK